MDKLQSGNVEEEPIHFEEALVQYVGGFGRFQKLLLVLVCMIVLPLGSYNSEIVFVAATPDFWCTSGDAFTSFSNNSYDEYQMKIMNISQLTDDVNKKDSTSLMNTTGLSNLDDASSSDTKWDQCYTRSEGGNNSDGRMEKCTEWAYDRSEYKSTIVTEFDLVCDKHMLVTTIKSLTVAGKIISGIIGGYLQDRFGRQKIAIASSVVITACRILEMVAPSFIVFAIPYTIRCGAINMLYISIFVLMAEMVAPNKRAFVGTAAGIPFAIGHIYLAGIAYLIRERWLLQLINTLLAFIFLGLIWMPESTRWLFAINKQNQGYKSLKRVADYNNRSLPQDLLIKVQKESRGSLKELCASGMVPRLIIMSFAWFMAAMVFYALALNIEDFAGNIYLNNVIMVLCGGVGGIISKFMLTSCLGRRGSSAILFTTAGLPLVITLFVPSNLPLINTGLFMLGKLGASGAYNVVYIYAAELFPTTVRGKGISVANFSSKIGGSLAPFVWKLEVINRIIPMVIYGTLSVLAGMLCLLLPETKNKALPQNMTELKPTKSEINEPQKRENILLEKTKFDGQ